MSAGPWNSTCQRQQRSSVARHSISNTAANRPGGGSAPAPRAGRSTTRAAPGAAAHGRCHSERTPLPSTRAARRRSPSAGGGGATGRAEWEPCIRRRLPCGHPLPVSEGKGRGCRLTMREGSKGTPGGARHGRRAWSRAVSQVQPGCTICDELWPLRTPRASPPRPKTSRPPSARDASCRNSELSATLAGAAPPSDPRSNTYLGVDRGKARAKARARTSMRSVGRGVY